MASFMTSPTSAGTQTALLTDTYIQRSGQEFTKPTTRRDRCSTMISGHVSQKHTSSRLNSSETNITKTFSSSNSSSEYRGNEQKGHQTEMGSVWRKQLFSFQSTIDWHCALLQKREKRYRVPFESQHCTSSLVHHTLLPTPVANMFILHFTATDFTHRIAHRVFPSLGLNGCLGLG